eukprot:TRINITY_DN1434_c0_g2_i1.p1 TRINITY_DN1434_c0_g2~~TRINITY_DN1434_c0_g2_i1.p1  ORF type:complete len:234 (+),score=-17.50 TRINITY_DN1434_c0_g2_i1:352-1053(+)
MYAPKLIVQQQYVYIYSDYQTIIKKIYAVNKKMLHKIRFLGFIPKQSYRVSVYDIVTKITHKISDFFWQRYFYKISKNIVQNQQLFLVTVMYIQVLTLISTSTILVEKSVVLKKHSYENCYLQQTCLNGEVQGEPKVLFIIQMVVILKLNRLNFWNVFDVEKLTRLIQISRAQNFCSFTSQNFLLVEAQTCILIYIYILVCIYPYARIIYPYARIIQLQNPQKFVCTVELSFV